MWLRIILGFLFVVQINSLSLLTDNDSQNITSVDKAGDTQTDIFRQLLNQETLMRMAMDKRIQSIMKDIIEMKGELVTNSQQLRDAEKEISALKSEVHSLRTENQALKAESAKFQEVISQFENRFQNIDDNFTQIAKVQARHERHWNDKMETFTENTSKILDDIKIEVRYLSVTLLDLNKHTMELNGSIPSLIDNKFSLYSNNLNSSMNEMNQMLLSSRNFQEKVVYNLSALEKDQYRLRRLLSENLNTTINTIKTDVEQSQNAQLKLSSAVSSLELFRMNMSLLNSCAKTTHIGFTVGMTLSDSTWSGDTLMFSYVVSNTENAYNPSTGKFTSPNDGTYAFFVNVNVHGGNYIYLDIVHNSASKVRTMSHNTAQYRTGTNMVVLQLSKGDSVWVRRYSGKSYYSDSVPITTFSGFLL